jgi:hypothetical protein
MEKIDSFKNVKIGDFIKMKSADTWMIEEVLDIMSTFLVTITVFGGSGTDDWHVNGMRGQIDEENLSFDWMEFYLLTESEVMAYKL